MDAFIIFLTYDAQIYTGANDLLSRTKISHPPFREIINFQLLIQKKKIYRIFSFLIINTRLNGGAVAKEASGETSRIPRVEIAGEMSTLKV